MSLSRSAGGKRSGDGNLRNMTRTVKSYNWHSVTDKTKNIPKLTWSSNAKLKRSGGSYVDETLNISNILIQMCPSDRCLKLCLVVSAEHNEVAVVSDFKVQFYFSF